MAELKITILGCGSSGGVPRLGGGWGECDPENPKNQRLRCSILVEHTTSTGTTTVLIDTSPDMRRQLLDAGTTRIDAVLYTHSHADHVHGLDDLRMIAINMRQRLKVWADAPTKEALFERFGYAFVTPEGSPYPPILDMHDIVGDVQVEGPGGTITFTPFVVKHGSMDSLGFRIGNVAYLPDVESIPEANWHHIENLDCWIVDALRRAPHPSHSHLEQTLDWISTAKPKQAVLTNMHNDLDYATVANETAPHIQPAFDGMTLTFDSP